MAQAVQNYDWLYSSEFLEGRGVFSLCSRLLSQTCVSCWYEGWEGTFWKQEGMGHGVPSYFQLSHSLIEPIAASRCKLEQRKGCRNWSCWAKASVDAPGESGRHNLLPDGLNSPAWADHCIRKNLGHVSKVLRKSKQIMCRWGLRKNQGT